MMSTIKKIIHGREEYYPNKEIFSYHALKFIHKLLIKTGLVAPPKNKHDMFNWSLYHLHYRGELKSNAKKSTLFLKQGDYRLTGNQLTQINTSIKPLDASPLFLYETILQLRPNSIFEMGCGTGIHIHNLHVLLPHARISGIDLAEQQLKELAQIHPDIAHLTSQSDATIPFTRKPFPPCELAFTQAVIMHIHTDNLYLVALQNLFAMSTKYVIMMEGIRARNYKADIQKLFDQGKIAWKQIFFYYRINSETGQPNGIICSNTPLPYPELKDYSIFHAKK